MRTDRLLRHIALVYTAAICLTLNAGTPPAPAKDFIYTRTEWSGQHEFWMVGNRSTDRPIRVTLRYRQICTGPETFTTETITLEPGEVKRGQRKNQYTGCGDRYLNIAGAYYL